MSWLEHGAFSSEKNQKGETIMSRMDVPELSLKLSEINGT